jgi:hypothetical protein
VRVTSAAAAAATTSSNNTDWTFTQDGGVFQWTAPSGRTYAVSPDIHPV